MIYSEDNYGRFEAMDFLWSWIAVGGAAMFLLLRIIAMTEQGLPDLKSAVVPVIALGALLYLSTLARTNLEDVRDIYRCENTPVPPSLLAVMSALSLLLGAALIFAYTSGRINHFIPLGFPFNSIAAGIVVMALCLSFFWFVAWFVIYPGSNTKTGS